MLSLTSVYVQGLLAIALLIAPSSQHPTSPFTNTNAFSNPTFSTSSGGFADCVSGIVKVPVTTNSNEKLNFNEPADQLAVTASFVHFLQANSSQAVEINGGLATVSETFNIAAKLCYPKNWSGASSSIQFLNHGIGFTQAYWDFAKGYSFIDAAAKDGYPTFSFDRLGVGASDHPDPIQVVQASIQVEIAHTLVTFLRQGKLAGHSFKNVIGVGHSFGSIQLVGILAKYPKDFDAVVLTGFSTSQTGVGLTIADFNSAIANKNQPSRFGSLPNGYLVVDSAISNQFAFFHYPDFDPNIFNAATASKQTFTYGEIFTLTSVIARVLNFTGPVDTVIGEFDWIFAQGNANFPTDQAALVQPELFPNSTHGSQSFVVPGAGHAINLHFGASLAFAQIQGFVKGNGF